MHGSNATNSNWFDIPVSSDKETKHVNNYSPVPTGTQCTRPAYKATEQKTGSPAARPPPSPRTPRTAYSTKQQNWLICTSRHGFLLVVSVYICAMERWLGSQVSLSRHAMVLDQQPMAFQLESGDVVRRSAQWFRFVLCTTGNAMQQTSI